MRLEVIFSEMAACKDDSQQRSWALHEDESVITEYLTELVSILVRYIFTLRLHPMLLLGEYLCLSIIAPSTYKATLGETSSQTDKY